MTGSHLQSVGQQPDAVRVAGDARFDHFAIAVRDKDVVRHQALLLHRARTHRDTSTL